jgi:cellulose synthase/poly-beta-1,6-N-acetylglucosamine synthase-like glycosyltransferase
MAEAYDPQRVEILILDDSDDDTIDEIDEVVKIYQEKGAKIEVLRRESRQGFKAGALQYALDRTEAEFIAIFDSDFTPPADFLLRTVPHFTLDETLGVIQSRWTHINRDYNMLTRGIAIGIDVHFLIEQVGRYAAGCFQNFNGSGGVIRKKALLQAGGWQSDTLTEDLDASYRIQMQGYRILFLKDLECPGEIPPTVPSFKKQQGRWACGSLRTAKKHLPSLLANKEYGFKQRLEAFIHLTGYMVHPLMLSSFLLACLATLFRVDNYRIVDTAYLFTRDFVRGVTNAGSLIAPQYLIWALIGLLIILCTVSAWIPPILVLRAQRLPLFQKPASFLILLLLGFGVSLNNTIEAGKALLTNRHWSFSRTPKYAVQLNKEAWQDKRYQVPLDFVAFLELAMVCLGGISIGFSIWNSNFGVLVILIPFTAAFTFVFLLTLLQSRQEREA